MNQKSDSVHDPEMIDELMLSALAMSNAPNYNRWIADLIGEYLYRDVLEVGCGVGNFSRFLLESPRVRSLHCIDISNAAIAYCREHFQNDKIRFDRMGVDELKGKYDTIICLNVLEHIEDDIQSLHHMISLLQPGGFLFLLVPAHSWLFCRWDEAAGHWRRYNKRGVLRVLRQSVGDLTPFNIRQFYFNAIGALGYFLVFRLLRESPRQAGISKIGFFDRFLVPILRHIEGDWLPFGISVITVIEKR